MTLEDRPQNECSIVCPRIVPFDKLVSIILQEPFTAHKEIMEIAYLIKVFMTIRLKNKISFSHTGAFRRRQIVDSSTRTIVGEGRLLFRLIYVRQ